MATRICVKNLAKDVEERQLAQHFEAFGPFTDVKLMRTGEGQSRGFGFIGFVDPAKGMEAIQYFNKSFIGTRRITVEVARKVGDASLSRPWSKYSKGSSSYRSLHPQQQQITPKKHKSAAEPTKPEEDDTELKAFLDIAMPAKNIQTWDKTSSSPQAKEGTNGKRKRSVNDDDRNDISEADRPQDLNDDPDEEETSRRLFIRNLPYSTTESDLIQAFSPYGDLTEVHLVTDKKSQKSKGIAFVEFEDAESAHAAVQELDGSIFQGRLLHILPSHNKPENVHTSETPGAMSNHSYKEQKGLKLKEQSGKRITWNTFYMRPDTITEAVADHYGITKGDLMHRDASDLGVRLALGEAHVIAQTKADLERSGIDVTQLEEAARASGAASIDRNLPRSDRIMIAKNLPYASNVQELKEMFETYGTVTQFVMPHTRTMAIVVFQEASDARRAFRGLAYKAYQCVPLYLEWAPRDIIKPAIEPPTDDQVGVDADGDVLESSGVTLYVKNLSFSTTDAKLSEHFDGAASEIGGQLRSAHIARKRHKNGSIVSTGFGFVEFDSNDVAKHVLHKLQSSMLDGHRLQLRFSHQKPKAQRVVEHQETEAGNKLIVKNLAFECTRKDVMDIFRPYGQMTRCRLPKKFDGGHRGFAFLEFVTRQSASAAVEAVGGIHLYGRRLNVEYAKDEEM